MTAVTSPQTQPQQRDPDRLLRFGGWLFRHRTLIPVPLAIPLLFIRAGEVPWSPTLVGCGAVFVAIGEIVRLWGVHHIGVVSRTRSDRLGPLIASGPFAHVRNPLYLGNLALWSGFAVAARLLWMVPVTIALLGLEYHAIVRWEERLLESRFGDRYRSYAARVPRWIPAIKPLLMSEPLDGPRSWRTTLFSERGTLLAIALGSILLWLKS